MRPTGPAPADSHDATDAQAPATDTQALAKATAQAMIAAKTVAMAMEGKLFGEAPSGLRSKQHKPDTQDGWASVQAYASAGVPFQVFLHQRHYGGAFRQVLDATSTLRGDLIEDAPARIERSRAEDAHARAGSRGVRLAGVRAARYFLGPALWNLGVRTDFVRIGDWKSAPEQFTRDGSTGPAREQEERFEAERLLAERLRTVISARDERIAELSNQLSGKGSAVANGHREDAGQD